MYVTYPMMWVTALDNYKNGSMTPLTASAENLPTLVVGAIAIGSAQYKNVKHYVSTKKKRCHLVMTLLYHIKVIAIISFSTLLTLLTFTVEYNHTNWVNVNYSN